MADGGGAGSIPMRVWPGHPDPLGATWDGMGVNFALFSENATKVELCLFDSDLYQQTSRKPSASLNFVTCHDGFTLRDLVSYQCKHNEANGENNRDGTDQNNSWNCGVEGPTDDVSINALRGRQQRNFLATLLLSQGVPMLLAGDESCHTQLGNNNAYCQDSALTWLNWDLAPEQRDLLESVRALTKLRTRNPVFRRRHFFQGRPIHGLDVKDLYAKPAAEKEAFWAEYRAGVEARLPSIEPDIALRFVEMLGENVYFKRKAHAL